VVTVHDDTVQPRREPAAPILEMRGMTKRFPGTLALDNVDLTVRRGEIHALVGQNGAGKSTLMKILAGDYSATAGSIAIDGRPVTIRTAREARQLGIGIVYQELSLLANLTVADNLSLGREPVRGVLLDQRTVTARARAALARMGIGHIDVGARVATLDLPDRQLVEIAKVLSLQPRLLILDEPTAPLTYADTERLFAILVGLKRHDIGIIYITHRFTEILTLCDRGTVLRGGRAVGVFATAELTLDRLVDATLGQPSDVFFRRTVPHDATTHRDVVLSVRHMNVGHRVRDVSFSVQRGEIVGLCGLLGAGQNDLGRALFGDRGAVSGVIELEGTPVVLDSPRQARGRGIGFLSDSRRDEGIFPDMRVEDNVTIASLGDVLLAKAVPLIRRGALHRRALAAAARTNMAPQALARAMRLLSGGNQQKALLARWLMRDARVLVLLEPTRGVDVGAKTEVYRQLDALAHDGKAIIVVSTDIPEILGLADRIVVMYQGSISATMTRPEATEEKIALAMQGVRVDARA